MTLYVEDQALGDITCAEPDNRFGNVGGLAGEALVMGEVSRRWWELQWSLLEINMQLWLISFLGKAKVGEERQGCVYGVVWRGQ